ncbi:MAG: NERD domain-containing protein [Anaerolineae bacterium]|nr:NERD domain-containing protein [Anaerolineae bacterium]
MRLVVNEEKITRGARLGKIATFVGLGFLVAGFIISLTLRDLVFLWVSLGCLVIGMLISSVGTMNMNRWVREPRADQALAQGLKGFDDRYVLYSYVLPVPHVLLSPAGLFILTAMGQDGTIRYDGEKFSRNFSLGRVLRFMAEEGLGRPVAEAESQSQTLQKFLEEQELGEDVEIQNVLVFYNPRAELDVSESQVPIVNPKGLKKAIRKQADEKLPARQYQALRELFDGRTEA